MQLSLSELEHYTNLWCRTKGIHAIDLIKHRQVDTLIPLIKLRDEFWSIMTSEERGLWAFCWGWVYTNKLPLKKKHTSGLEKTINNIQYRLKLHEQQRQKIKQLRKA